MNILGISAFFHDSAAALIRNGEIISAAQEERFTRKKHDSDFPVNAIKFCLEHSGLDAKDLDHVVFYEKPILKFNRIFETYLSYAPRGIKSFIKAMPVWLEEKLWTKDLILEKLGNDKVGILFPEHHESHAASAFYPSPFKEAAILTIDGVGEWATTSYGIGQDHEINLIAELKFPHSLGLLYSAFTSYAGFKVNSGEYKLMGLAPYGEPKYVRTILSNLIDLKEDGSFKINMQYFNYGSGLTMTSTKFHQLFGGSPRHPESKITQKEMDMACSIQHVTDEIMVRMARYIRKETGQKNLCLAGGVALNCVSNGKILKDGAFENIWIQPAAGDSGGALGAALLGWHQYLGNPRRVTGNNDSQKGSLLGPEFSNAQIEAFLKERSVQYRTLQDREIPEITSDLISKGNVIGWFQGRMEFGPRALGSRSILGDPRSPKMQEIINLKIKFRESFRPFAPSVLADKASDFFELSIESPYMLLVVPVKESIRRKMTEEESRLFGIEKLNIIRSTIPAVTHVDYSARVQTVNGSNNPLFHKTLKAFYEKTQCPVLINTSFNVRGEPIVRTPQEAYRCFMRTNMDYLMMGNYLIDKKDQNFLDDDANWHKQFSLD